MSQGTQRHDENIRNRALSRIPSKYNGMSENKVSSEESKNHSFSSSPIIELLTLTWSSGLVSQRSLHPDYQLFCFCRFLESEPPKDSRLHADCGSLTNFVSRKSSLQPLREVGTCTLALIQMFGTVPGLSLLVKLSNFSQAS